MHVRAIEAIHDLTISYPQFKQLVRRYRPSDVLSASALASVENLDIDSAARLKRHCYDFALAGVCNAAVCYGNEYRRASVRRADLQVMCSAFVALDEPLLTDGDVAGFSVRIGFEQLPYQAPIGNELARTRALFVEAAQAADQDLITPDFWVDLLGCSIEQFVSLAFLFSAGATKNRGVFRREWLDQTNFKKICSQIDRVTIENVFDRHFCQSRDTFRITASATRQRDEQYQRYRFNPLLTAPFIELPDFAPVAPVIPLVLWRATPGSLYYAAVSKYGNAFAEALGITFEYYVGVQLGLCMHERLIPEIVYDSPKGMVKSVDHILVTKQAIVLVEAKAGRLTEQARVGKSKLKDDFERTPEYGVTQIERTAERIRERHPAFHFIPSDRPIVGVVVTLEPFFMCASDLVFPSGERAVPVWLSSIRDLENLVVRKGDQIGEFLLDEYAKEGRDHWDLSRVVEPVPTHENSVLSRAVGSLPF